MLGVYTPIKLSKEEVEKLIREHLTRQFKHLSVDKIKFEVGKQRIPNGWTDDDVVYVFNGAICELNQGEKHE